MLYLKNIEFRNPTYWNHFPKCQIFQWHCLLFFDLEKSSHQKSRFVARFEPTLKIIISRCSSGLTSCCIKINHLFVLILWFIIKRPVSRGLKLRDVFERAQIKSCSWHLPKSVRWVFIVASVFQFESRKGSMEYIPNWSPPFTIFQISIFKLWHILWYIFMTLWHIPNWKYFWKISYDINSSVYWNCLGTPNAFRKWGNIRPSRFLWISPDFISRMTVILNISVSTNHKVGIIWFKPNHCWTHHLFM